MTDEHRATFLAAIASGHEIRLTVGDDTMLFGAPVRIEGRAVYLAPRGGGGVQSYALDDIVAVKVLLASRVSRPRPARGR